ncbi:hypothetical protein [Kordia sp.]|uniref:hypothetical protein n=1 Tax=Kordia sp. TaxID=1965332 RepID=UPI0025C6A38C|nr:hypothetical protein [Kordia sp.]MCH2196482.1 hypothetical protein [Kordia sp.]
MNASNQQIVELKSTREVDRTKKSLLIKDAVNSIEGFTNAYDTQINETFWIGKNRVEEYQGEFTDIPMEVNQISTFYLMVIYVTFTHKDQKI